MTEAVDSSGCTSWTATASSGDGGDRTQIANTGRRSVRAKRSSTAAAAVAAAAEPHSEQQHDTDQSSDVECAAEVKQFALSTGKQLTSRYRGVCWNKKNKRWQAAINSGGKYIYLGSYTTEDDAARQFDRAAIKIRGKKAKVNFSYSDYVDADGVLLEELVLPAASSSRGASSKANNCRMQQQHGSPTSADEVRFQQPGFSGLQALQFTTAAAPCDSSAVGTLSQQAVGTAVLSSDELTTAWRQQQQQQQQQLVLPQQQQQLHNIAPMHHSRPELPMQGVTTDPFRSHQQQLSDQAPQVTPGSVRHGVTPQLLAHAETPDMYKRVLPHGSSLDFSVIGQFGLFGLVFKCNTTRRQGCGVWTGQALKIFGAQRDQRDALKTVLTALRLLEQQHQQQQQHINSSVAPTVQTPPQTTAAVAAAGNCQLSAATGSRYSLSPDSYNSMAHCHPSNLGSNAYTGPLLPVTASGHGGHHGHNGQISRSLSARLASCDLSEALSLAQQAAAEQGYPDLAAALKQMSSSNGLGTYGLTQSTLRVAVR